jgi:hypothetical protein
MGSDQRALVLAARCGRSERLFGALTGRLQNGGCGDRGRQKLPFIQRRRLVFFPPFRSRGFVRLCRTDMRFASLGRAFQADGRGFSAIEGGLEGGGSVS